MFFLLKKLTMVIGISIACVNAGYTESAYYSSKKGWMEHKYSNVMPQIFDTSCGAASVSNILIQYYGKNITEMHVLKEMGISKSTYSFLDLAKAVEKLGFTAVLFSLDYEGIRELKMPVVVHDASVRDGHFVVIRAIDSNYVLVSDPAAGNRRYTRSQFENTWGTVDKRAKMLAILQRANPDSKVRESYFGKIAKEDINSFYVGSSNGFIP